MGLVLIFFQKNMLYTYYKAVIRLTPTLLRLSTLSPPAAQRGLNTLFLYVTS